MTIRLRRRAACESAIGWTRIFNPSYKFLIVLCLAVLGVVSVAQSAHAQSADTDETPQDQVSDTDEPLPSEIFGTDPPQGRIFIENKTGYPIGLIEYDGYDDTYRPYVELAGGETFMQTVGAGVMWLFRVNQEAYIAKYITTDAPDQWLILDEKTLIDAGYQPKSK